MDQVEAAFGVYLRHQNGNPLVYDTVRDLMEVTILEQWCAFYSVRSSVLGRGDIGMRMREAHFQARSTHALLS